MQRPLPFWTLVVAPLIFALTLLPRALQRLGVPVEWHMIITTLAWVLVGLLTTYVWVEWARHPLRCERCQHCVPRWFGEKLPMGDGGSNEWRCRVCLGESDRHPKLWEWRGRIEKYAATWRAAILEKQGEARRLEAAKSVTCPVCEKEVQRGDTVRESVQFSKTPGRLHSRPAYVCLICVEEHVAYGMPLTAGAALTWKRKENANP